MTAMRYRLTTAGWVGAALFVLPTPLAAWHYQAALNKFEGMRDSQRAILSIHAPDFSPFYLTLLATASLVGLVLLLVGREVQAR